jgi:hypothetical protein
MARSIGAVTGSAAIARVSPVTISRSQNHARIDPRNLKNRVGSEKLLVNLDRYR